MNGTILIVDDEEDTAVLLRDSLRKRGFDVDAVGLRAHESFAGNLQENAGISGLAVVSHPARASATRPRSHSS